MTPVICEDLRARRMAVFDAHFDLKTVPNDVQAALATFHHPRYEVPAAGAAVDGADGVDGLPIQLLTAFPDFRLERLPFTTQTMP